jgi:hypothetical protein
MAILAASGGQRTPKHIATLLPRGSDLASQELNVPSGISLSMGTIPVAFSARNPSDILVKESDSLNSMKTIEFNGYLATSVTI